MSRSRTRRRTLTLESLEGKQLLSTVHSYRLPASHAVAPMKGVGLDGTLAMPVASIATFQQGGQTVGTYKVQGRVGSMGPASGEVVAVLDAKGAMTKGMLHLSNRRGGVYFAMKTDPVDAKSYDITVDHGTDAFASAAGSGKMTTTTLSPDAKTLHFAIRMNGSS